MKTSKLWHLTWLGAAATIASAFVTSSARILFPIDTTGGQQTAVSPTPDAPPPGFWFNAIHLSAQVEGGISFNPAAPKGNFGQLFTDHDNQPLLNQIL